MFFMIGEPGSLGFPSLGQRAIAGIGPGNARKRAGLMRPRTSEKLSRMMQKCGAEENRHNMRAWPDGECNETGFTVYAYLSDAVYGIRGTVRGEK